MDNDDTSVQLLPDDMSVAGPSGMATGGMMPLDGMPPGGEFPPYAEQVGPPPMVGPMYPPNMPMQYPPGMMGYPTNCEEVAPGRARLSADVDLMLLRPQIAESAAGSAPLVPSITPITKVRTSGPAPVVPASVA